MTMSQMASWIAIGVVVLVALSRRSPRLVARTI